MRDEGYFPPFARLFQTIENTVGDATASRWHLAKLCMSKGSLHPIINLSKEWVTGNKLVYYGIYYYILPSIASLALCSNLYKCHSRPWKYHYYKLNNELAMYKAARMFITHVSLCIVMNAIHCYPTIVMITEPISS